jgi:hypothetical protein
MNEPKIDLSEIFNELDSMKKRRAFIPTDEQLEIIKHGRPDVSYHKLADVINKYYNLNITDSNLKYYCDNHGIP